MAGVTIISSPETLSEQPAQVETSHEAVAEAAVEVAQIEADRDVAIAEIHAESRESEATRIAEAVVEAAEHNTDEELEECRRNLETLQAENSTLREELTLIQSQAELPPPPNPEQEKSVEAGPPAVESQEAPPAPPKPAKKLNWI